MTASAVVLVGVHPARELVQVVPDPRDLAGALALDGPCRSGPSPRPGHRLAKQSGGGHARRGRLVPPGGVLRRRHAGDHEGGAVSHGRPAAGARGAASRDPPLTAQRRGMQGDQKGGAAPPRQP